MKFVCIAIHLFMMSPSLYVTSHTHIHTHRHTHTYIIYTHNTHVHTHTCTCTHAHAHTHTLCISIIDIVFGIKVIHIIWFLMLIFINHAYIIDVILVSIGMALEIEGYIYLHFSVGKSKLQCEQVLMSLQDRCR